LHEETENTIGCKALVSCNKKLNESKTTSKFNLPVVLNR